MLRIKDCAREKKERKKFTRREIKDIPDIKESSILNNLKQNKKKKKKNKPLEMSQIFFSVSQVICSTHSLLPLDSLSTTYAAQCEIKKI